MLVVVACSCSHVAYNALRMEPVFMALGQAAGIASHLAIERNVAVRHVPTAELQRLLVERGGVVTFYRDLPFEDPAFAAFQWLGTRGLNSGYDATAKRKLTRRDGWIRLARIVRAEGKAWFEPHDKPDADLHGQELAEWLREAGYQPTDPEFKQFWQQQLSLAQFALLTYRTLSPAP